LSQHWEGGSAVLRIHNSLTRTKEEFQPLAPPRVTFYNCGPTVYDYFHIGNARNFVLADTIRRYLRFRGFEVRFVQNITDIDDKIIRRAQLERRSTAEIAETFTRAYFEHIQALGIEPADVHPRATEHIPQMVRFIQTLIEKGYAYRVGGDVYYRINRFPQYGKLSHKNIDQLRKGERISVDPRKEDPKDFDLWKAAKPGEPSWESPWGPGRPGWHVECSVMSSEHLGETIDIHSGGSDLVFPHHENELAQSEAATGKPFVRYWIHNAFLNIGGEKMSKSLGNFVTMDQVLAHYEPMVVRYFFLSAHYRSPMDYGPASLEEARRALNRLVDGVVTIGKVLDLVAPGETGGPAACAVEDTTALAAVRAQFIAHMDDDFNTPRALSVLFEAVGDLHEKRRQFEDPRHGPARRACARAAVEQIRELAGVLGLDLAYKSRAAELPAEPILATLDEALRRIHDDDHRELVDAMAGRMERIGFRIDATAVQPSWAYEGGARPENERARELLEAAIDARHLMRAARRFDLADAIRTGLSGLGIILEDYRAGTIWKKVA